MSTYVSRFGTVSEAITYAEANGQGTLTLNPDGSIFNSNGEAMGYDSAGNLAPQGYASAVSVPEPVVVASAPKPSGDFGRFLSVSAAIDYAVANGQGTLSVQFDGTVTNESGQIMVYDSSGNLAPSAAVFEPVAGVIGGIVPDPVADAAVEITAVSNTVKIPKVGSAEYKALLLETGRTDLIGFNYEAHLSVKKEVNTEALDIYLEAENGIALLGQLASVDINALFATASPTQILELTTKFADDQAFQAFLASETTPVAPEEGSAEYDQLLEDTGKADLTDFDYEDFVFSKTNAEQALIRAGLDKKFGNIKVRSGTNPEGVIQNHTTPLALIGSTGSDKVVGGLGDDVLISSGGEDVLEGGAGVDLVIMSKSAAKSQVVRDSVSDNWIVTGDSGSDTLVDVERVMFDDSSLALDVGKDEIGGKTALLLGALLGPDAINNPAYVGTVIGLLDGGMSIDELAAVAIESLSLTSNEALITTLWENLLGVEPTESEKASVIELLDNGLTSVELILLAADSEINESNIDLIGIAQTGLSYSVDTGG